MSETDSPAKELIPEIGTADFARCVEGSPLPVVAEFSADWCSLCKAAQPTLHAVAEMYSSRIQFVRIDADRSPELVEKFDIASLPTLIFLRNGSEAERLPSIPSRAKLIQAIEKFLG